MNENASKKANYLRDSEKYPDIYHLSDDALEQFITDMTFTCLDHERGGSTNLLIPNLMNLQVAIGEKNKRTATKQIEATNQLARETLNLTKKTIGLWWTAIGVGILGIIIGLLGIWQ
jgi:hypothetical protein